MFVIANWYLLSKITPMLEKYQAAITLKVYALIEDATAAARAKGAFGGGNGASATGYAVAEGTACAAARAGRGTTRGEEVSSLPARPRPTGRMSPRRDRPAIVGRRTNVQGGARGKQAGSPRERRRRVSRRRERAWARTVYVVEIAFRGRRRPRRATVRGPPRRARVLGFTTPRRDPRATDRVRRTSPGLTRPAPANLDFGPDKSVCARPRTEPRVRNEAGAAVSARGRVRAFG